MAKAADLRELPDEVLLEQVESAKEELFNLRFQLATGELDNPGRLKTVRHDVARILTVLRERDSERELEESFARVEVATLDEEARAAESGDAAARGDEAAAGERPRGRLLRRRRGAQAARDAADEAADEAGGETDVAADEAGAGEAERS
jgi:large subunit ribosomal protein L29